MVRAAAAAQTFYRLCCRGPLGSAATLTLEKKVAGVVTSLGSAVVAAASGDVLRLTVIGTALTATLNGVPKLAVVDSAIASGSAGVYLICSGGAVTDTQLDDWSADNAPPQSHTVSGTGSITVSAPAFLALAISGRPARLSSGAANPPNWYHVGMLSWGTANGAMVAYPVTRDADLVQLPAGMSTVWYEFASGVTAVITELTAP